MEASHLHIRIYTGVIMANFVFAEAASARALKTLCFSMAVSFPLQIAIAGPNDIDAPPSIKEEPGKPESKLPDIENGKNVARKLCTTCHLIGEPASAPMPTDVPTFASIAQRPGQTADHISTWLTRPHPPMPNLNLTRLEIRDLTGYILSLRTQK